MTTPAETLHRVPRHPHAWLWVLLLSQALVALAWWHWGWRIGLPLMMATHLVFWWGVLWPQSRFYSPVLTRLPIADKRVWLTIDDGPSDDTLAILDALDAYDAKATFFVVGKRAAARPDLVREIARRGHTLGNHSATHPSAWFWMLPRQRMAREIADAQATLQAITGRAPRWFRAVVGMANPFVSAPLRLHGLARVAWNARGFDAVEGDSERVVARIERDLAPGAIVLLHEGARHGRNVETIARLLQRLQALGYKTILPEVLEVAGFAPTPANAGGDEARLRAIGSRAEERLSAGREGRNGWEGGASDPTDSLQSPTAMDSINNSGSDGTPPRPSPAFAGEGDKQI